ncbi:Uncharacterised protein [Mycobacterium tuberculosis]|nr:Uncharacterised protein [Mycobacterium tuberculosis]
MVGQVWLSAAHCGDATTLLDHISSTTTMISAITHAGRRPNPRKYATAHAALHAISTPNSTHAVMGCRKSELIAVWKPSA